MVLTGRKTLEISQRFFELRCSELTQLTGSKFCMQATKKNSIFFWLILDLFEYCIVIFP
jgi:hypothetical protein